MSDVQLAVYDLSRGMAGLMSQQILGQRIEGIWHTGIRVFNKEWYFGGGIQVSPIGFFERNSGLAPTRLQLMGRTTRTEADLRAYISTINAQWSANTYNLITHNCNNFSDTICAFLMDGTGIPREIVDLPQRVFSTPVGQMLRPMIEGMQQSIQSDSAHNFDPFAGSFIHGRAGPVEPFTTTSGANYGSTFASNGQSLGYSADGASRQGSAVPQIARPVSLVRAQLEESFLISAQSAGANGMITRLTALTSGASEALLSTSQKECMQDVAAWIADSSCKFPTRAYEVLTALATSHVAAQTPSLFLLRVMVAGDQALKLGASEHARVVAEHMGRLASQLLISPAGASGGAASGIVAPLGSVSAQVMGLCTLSNWVSSLPNIAEALLATPGMSAEAVDQLLDRIVDVTATFMSHERVELRQISAALGYNIALHNTKGDRASAAWGGIQLDSGQAVAAELHAHAVQLLCCSLEKVAAETDATARVRRLSLTLRIVRAFGSCAISFIRDLDFHSIFPPMLARLQASSATTDALEILVLQELLASTRLSTTTVPAPAV
jgi:hypothetical protein